MTVAPLTVFISLWGFLWPGPASVQATVHQKLFEKTQLSDLRFSQDQLFTWDGVTNDLRCAILCARYDSCVTFTFASQSACSGHSSSMTSVTPSTSEVGAVTFQVVTQTKWVGQTCSANTDCTTQNSECFKNQCLCTPGYYFSEGTGSCVLTCQPDDRGTNYQTYPGSAISASSLSTTTQTSELHCRDACVAYISSACVGWIYTPGIQECMLQGVTPQDVPIAWNDNYVPANYYQRHCV